MKYVFVVVVSVLLAGCSVVDPFFGTGEATVLAVDSDRGCSVTFRMEGQRQTFVSVAETPYKWSRCKRLQPGMTVPVVTDPLYGDYPYVLFEETGG